VNHGLAQVFRAGLTAIATLGDSMRGTIVFDHHRVIDRDVCCALGEVRGGISTRPHNFRDQAIRACHGPRGIIDELALHFTPTVAEADLIFRRERPNVQRLSMLFTEFQQPLTFAYVAFLPDYAVILGAELLTQTLAAPLSRKNVHEGSDDYGCDYDQQYQNLS
jgi:hypothetical protein